MVDQFLKTHQILNSMPLDHERKDILKMAVQLHQNCMEATLLVVFEKGISNLRRTTDSSNFYLNRCRSKERTNNQDYANQY